MLGLAVRRLIRSRGEAAGFVEKLQMDIQSWKRRTDEAERRQNVVERWLDDVVFERGECISATLARTRRVPRLRRNVTIDTIHDVTGQATAHKPRSAVVRPTRPGGR